MSRFVNRRMDTSKPITFGVFESKFDLKGKFLYAMTKTPDGVFKFHRSIKSLFKELTSIPDITWFFHKDAQDDFDFAYIAYQMVEWAENHGHTVNHRSSGDTILGMMLRKPTVKVTMKPGIRKAQIVNVKSKASHALLAKVRHLLSKSSIRTVRPAFVSSAESENSLLPS